MIGHVAALQTSATYAPVALDYSVGVGSTHGDASVQGSGMAQSAAAMQINAQVAQLLSGIGGGGENKQLLQLMIGLMILITLLQGSQQAQSTAAAAKELSNLGAARNLGVGMTTTTFAFEQTTITPNAGEVDALQSAAQPTATQGQKVDLAA